LLAPNRFRTERGQSVVEFALVLPLLVFLMVGIVDLGRIYTTMLSVESAAREAADFGSFDSSNWSAGQIADTELNMETTACVAASNLPDYVGPDDNCANPSFSYLLSMDKGTPGSWVDWATTAADPVPCDSDARAEGDDPADPPPCWVRVTLTYEFHLLVPLGFEAFGVRYGLPNTITFERSSTFANTDLSLP
jgi:TadE-like protein